MTSKLHIVPLLLIDDLHCGALSWCRRLQRRPRPATVAGRVLDTGLGYPALLPGGPASAAGQLVAVRDTVALLRRLDRYEGRDYQRIRVGATTAGNPQLTACWTYAWIGDEAALRSADGCPTGERSWRRRSGPQG